MKNHRWYVMCGIGTGIPLGAGIVWLAQSDAGSFEGMVAHPATGIISLITGLTWLILFGDERKASN